MARLGLTWVLVDGQPRCVSDFAGLPPRRRPRATCPQCGRKLTLKLGRIRRHHAAHPPDDICRATQPAVVADDVVRAVDRSLEAERIEHVWLSHPTDWTRSRSDLPWAAAARDTRGRDVVLVDGVGVFRASAFAEAFRRGDAKVRSAALLARMSARASSLPALH